MLAKEAVVRYRRLSQQEVDLVCARHDRLWTGKPGGERAVLAWADLTGLCLSNRNLCDADLTGAILAGVDFSNTKLDRANLFGADLQEAKLLGASLKRADLSGPCLRGA